MRHLRMLDNQVFTKQRMSSGLIINAPCNYGVAFYYPADRLRRIVYSHTACHCSMEHYRAMLDSIYLHPHRYLVVSRISSDLMVTDFLVFMK